jgi:hypothetical protein
MEFVRWWILRHMELLASIDLPAETFLPQVSVQASCLFLRRRTENEYRMGDSYGSIFAGLDCAEGNGIELLSQRDMFRAEPAGRWIRKDSLPDPDAHLIKPWQVLIAGTGTLPPPARLRACRMSAAKTNVRRLPSNAPFRTCLARM